MLTPVRIKKLRAAIDAARKPGNCAYVVGGKPCCVIAQLAHSEGVPLATLRQWDERGLPIAEIKDSYPLPKKLEAYPMSLLRGIQMEWDGADVDDAKVARVKMHGLVDGEVAFQKEAQIYAGPRKARKL